MQLSAGCNIARAKGYNNYIMLKKLTLPSENDKADSEGFHNPPVDGLASVDRLPAFLEGIENGIRNSPIISS